MAYQYLVPADTVRILQTRADECLNLGLVLARYIPHEAIRNDDIYNDRGRSIGKMRSEWLRDTVSRFTAGALERVLVANYERWLAMTGEASRFEMRALGRMIVGLGGKGPLEFGITLDKLTGLPYIPGSALKGLCRSYALLSLAAEHGIAIETEQLEKFDTALVEGKDYQSGDALHYSRAFGSQENAGGCVFYPATLNAMRLVKEDRLFTLDVMTPHFVDYYTSSGSKAPDDGGNPNPVTYITVTEGMPFVFAIGKRANFTDDGAIKQARRWLRAALQEMGAGAKTAQGYGVFAPHKSG